MAIKRKTVYEYDTSPDPSGGLTGAPSSTLPLVQNPDVTKSETTNIPSNQESYKDDSENQVSQKASSPTQTGRTGWDLAYLFLHEEQLPAIVFFFIVLIIFHDQIKSTKDFRLVGFTWSIVCIIWYGSSVIRKLVNRIKRKN